MSQFVDEAVLKVSAGNGGHGLIAFRREKFVPRGGPNGGDGGRGGDVVAEVDANLHTLLDLRYRTQIKAERGAHGQGSGRTGKSGEDAVIRVPPGTMISDVDTGEILGDLVEPGTRLVVARGGRGGRGNQHFAGPTHQSPQEAEDGRLGMERNIRLTLKLMAEVGLVGLPNAGKSTLLAAMSAARPKVGAYPFTTIEPNLGIVKVGEYQSLIMADVPGLIEGASEGKGLGHKFLRHLERTKVLLFLVDVQDPDPLATLASLQNEIQTYSKELAEKPSLVAFTKIELLGDQELELDLSQFSSKPFMISAHAHRGLTELAGALFHLIHAAPPSGDANLL